MPGESDVDIRVKLRDVTRFDRDAKRAARSIDNIGDQAAQAARKMRQLSKASADSRLNLGPLSFRAKTGALAVGAFAVSITKATPALLGFAEATGVVVVGAAGAGAVGLTALAQGFGVATLATGGLTKALGGNATALKQLQPEARKLFDMLHAKQQKLQGTATAALFPGLDRGAHSALRNFGRVNTITRRTGTALGGLASQAGSFLGSKSFGRDLSTVGNANVRIITNLGHAGLSLANAARSILVEAAPLAEWMSQLAARGSLLLDNWIQQKRAGGGLHAFFQQAKTDIQILGSITGHTGRGIINLFGSHDVDGTKTLRSLDHLTGSFERWTGTAKKGNLGQAIADQIPKAGGVIASALAHTLGAAVPQAAKIFWQAFWDSDWAGKALIGGAILKKTGAFGVLGGLLGRSAVGKGGALGAVSRKTPLPVFVVNEGFGGAAGAGGAGAAARVGTGALKAAGAVALPVGLGVALAQAIPVGARNPNLSAHGPVRGGAGLPIQINVHSHLNGREVARAVTQVNLAERARNAQVIDQSFGSRASGAGH